MMWVILFALFLFVILSLLLTPVVIRVDSRVPEVKFTWKGIGGVAIDYRGEEWFLKFRIFFYAKEIKLQAQAGAKKKPKRKKKHRANAQKLIKKFFAVIKSFKVPVCRISLDTHDYIYNAWLYPLNYLQGNHYCYINFYDENYFILELRNNAGRMLYAWLR